MAISLKAVPRKLKDDIGTGLDGTGYPDRIRIAEAMAAQDSRIVFDSLRPLADEYWNMIDGRRTLADIAAAICMQFGFELEPALFTPMAEGLVGAGLVALSDTED